MSLPARRSQVFRFEGLEVDLQAGELRRSGQKIKLQEQPLQILKMLLERPGEVVTREEIQQKLWPTDTFVEFDHSINAAIQRLRQALGDSADNPRFVETMARRGYRFIAPVETVGALHERRPEKEPAVADRRYSVRRLAGVGVGAIAVIGLLIALNVGGLRDRFLRRGAPLPKIESIAVLPLENLSHDPEQEYFADGMTDELITNLGKISALRVISRTSVMRYKATEKPLPEIAKELNVDAVVEGTVQRSGDRVRITAQLIGAVPERHLWAQSYERDLRDVLALQGEVARAVADQVRIKLTPQEETRLSRSRSVDPAAHEALLRGRHHLYTWSVDGYRKSIKYFQQAIDKDPQYAEAYAWLALAQCNLAYPGAEVPSESFRKAKASALKALEIDETTVEAHIALGVIKYTYEWDWSGAEGEYKRAIELNPSSYVAHQAQAGHLTWAGRFDEAVAEWQRAFRLEPLSRAGFAWTYAFARRHKEAIRELQAELEISPENPEVHRMLSLQYAALKLEGQAVAECRKSRELEPSPFMDITCAIEYAGLGNREQARKEFDKYMKAPYVDPYLVACY